MDIKTQTPSNGTASVAKTVLPEKVTETHVCDGRTFRVIQGGYLEDAMGRNIAHALHGNRLRVLKAFEAAIEECCLRPEVYWKHGN